MRKKKHADHVNHERWLVSYADFITLLFAFFTTLYAISTVDQQKAGKLQYSMMTAFNVSFFPAQGGISGGSGQSGAAMQPIIPAYAAAAQALQRLTRELEHSTESGSLKGRVKVRAGRGGVVVSMLEAGFFESGKAEVRPEARVALEALADQLSIRRHQTELVVEGHTDNIPVRGGRYGSNFGLSSARASYMVNFMLARHNFDAAFVSAAGYGEHRPVAPNETLEGRAKNRRVDIVVKLRSASSTTSAESESFAMKETSNHE